MIKSNKNYLFVALCLAVVLCTAMLLFGLNFNQSVYADYNDIIDDPNAIINFNQLIDIRTVASTDTVLVNANTLYFNQWHSGTQANFVDITLIANHKYYLSCSAGDMFNLNNNNSLRFNNIISVSTDTVVDYIYRLSWYNPIPLGQNVYFNIYDLSLMFGDNNIPTKEQCDELFVADYYAYNSGSPIYLNNIDSYSRGYSEGFNSAWESQNVTYKQSVLGSSAFPFNFGSYNDSTKIFDGAYQMYMIAGVIGLPLGSMSTGTNIEVDFTMLVPDWQNESLSFKQSFNMYFYYIDSNNNLVLCGTIPYSNIDGNYGTYKGAFNLPISTDTVYLYFSTAPYDFNDGISPTQCYVFDSNMTFRTQDIQSAINTAFQSGMDSVISSYEVGGTNYTKIYNAGKTAGMNENNPYTFGYLMSSVIEAPLNAVLSIFNFDFMGYNFKQVITLLLTVCVIIAIVRMFVGGNA